MRLDLIDFRSVIITFSDQKSTLDSQILEKARIDLLNFTLLFQPTSTQIQ